MRWPACTVLTALAGLLILGLAAAAPAGAHATLVGTSPGAGQTMTSVPTSIRLDFSGNVISIGLQLQVIGPEGLVNSGKAVVNRSTVTQPLASPLINGSYVVNWHVVHDDGHPDSGTFSFAVAVQGDAAATGPPVNVAPIPVDDTADRTGDRTRDRTADRTAEPDSLPPFFVVLGMFVVTLVVLVAVIIDRRRRREAGLPERSSG